MEPLASPAAATCPTTNPFLVTEGQRTLAVEPSALLLCGYTARDGAGIRAHVEELAREGVPAPETIPAFWRAPVDLLTAAPAITVGSPATSGEAEPVLVRGPGSWHVTVGSDHTDRRLERDDLAASKVACAKPFAVDSWPLELVAGRWDRLELHCDVLDDGGWVPYQEATLAHLRPVDELLRLASEQLEPRVGAVMFLGTVPLKTAGFVFASAYRIVLRDPVLRRELSCAYRVAVPARSADGGLESR